MIGILASITFTCVALQAEAQPPAQERVVSASPTSESDGGLTREWYGAPIVFVDLAALGAFFGGMVASDRGNDLGSALMIAGGGTYLLAAPLVHVTQHQVGRGFASLGLRTGAPLVGAVTGLIVGAIIGLRDTSEYDKACPKETWCGAHDMVMGGTVGFVGGLLVAAAVDSAALAYKPSTAKQLALSVTPIYQPVAHQTGLALRGTW